MWGLLKIDYFFRFEAKGKKQSEAEEYLYANSNNYLYNGKEFGVRLAIVLISERGVVLG